MSFISAFGAAKKKKPAAITAGETTMFEDYFESEYENDETASALMDNKSNLSFVKFDSSKNNPKNLFTSEQESQTQNSLTSFKRVTDKLVNIESMSNISSTPSSIPFGQSSQIETFYPNILPITHTKLFTISTAEDSNSKIIMTPIEKLSDETEPDAVFIGSAAVKAAITKKGKLFVWGSGSALCFGNKYVSVSVPKFVQSLEKAIVVSVSCGDKHAGAVTRAGNLYTWGQGLSGELGLGENCNVAELPMLVSGLGALSSTPDDDAVVAVSCGKTHTVVVTNCGAVFTMGDNTSGQLGQNDLTNRYAPTLISTLTSHTIAQIATGNTFTFCVTLSGRKCFQSGRFLSMQYLQPEIVLKSDFAQREIFQISASGDNCAFLVGDDDDRMNTSVYTFGRDAFMLGHGAGINDLRKVGSSKSSVKGSIIKNSNSKSTKIGSVIKQNDMTPKLVIDLEGAGVKQVSCGLNHMGVVCYNGDLFVWGQYEQEMVPRPKKLPKINGYVAKWVACGLNTTLGIFGADTVFSGDSSTIGKVLGEDGNNKFGFDV